MALQPNTLSRYVKAIQYQSLTDLLMHFRQQLERENGKPISEQSEINAAEVISDLCIFLGLSDQNRRKILGAKAVTWIDQTLAVQVEPRIQHFGMIITRLPTYIGERGIGKGANNGQAKARGNCGKG